MNTLALLAEMQEVNNSMKKKVLIFIISYKAEYRVKDVFKKIQGCQFGKKPVLFYIVFLLSLLEHELDYFLLVFDQNCRAFIEKKQSD